MPRLLHLDPSLPVVWRSPSSFQIGVDSPLAIVESVDQRYLPVLAALHSGISAEGIDAIASHEGLEPADTALFLNQLSAALDARAPNPSAPDSYHRIYFSPPGLCSGLAGSWLSGIAGGRGSGVGVIVCHVTLRISPLACR